MESVPTPRNEPDLVGLGGASRPRWLTAESIGTVMSVEEPPFGDLEYQHRLSRVRERMVDASLDALVVFRPSSVEYLCGFHTKETTPQPLLLTHDDSSLYVPDLEVGRALAGARVGTVVYGGYADALRGLVPVLEHVVRVVPRGARVAVELGQVSTPACAVEVLRSGEVEVVDGEHLVETVRLVLSAAEIGCVQEAALVTEAGVEAAIAAAQDPAATDSSVAAAISAALFAPANAASAWGPVVATGRRAGIAHSSWVRQRLSGATTLLEFAGAHHRYHAPVMRTLCHGDPPACERRLAALAKTALAAVLEHARAGVTCAEVARQALRALGPLPDDVVFHHLLGYPVGLAHPPHWMDGAPFYITADNHTSLQPGMVFHMPGSFRSFGNAGVGLSQTFVVEENRARPLTYGDADLIYL